jgi:hypothetical protein
LPLDDADRRSLEEIERQLTLETPRLAKALGRETPVRRSRVPAAPVALATAVLIAAFSWMSALTGSPVPLLLALPPAVAAVLLLVWERTADPAPPREGSSADAAGSARHDGPPTWWFT